MSKFKEPSDFISAMIQEGVDSSTLKYVIIEELKPYFRNHYYLQENVMDGNYITLYTYLLKYRFDTDFKKELKFILDDFNSAFDFSNMKMIDLFSKTFNLSTKAENKLKSFEKNTIDINEELHNLTFKCMSVIGNTIEGAFKYLLIEYLVALKIKFNKPYDLDKICKSKLGVIIQQIIDLTGLKHLFKPLPKEIKISDWRNISAHHDYSVNNEIITCTYGKTEQSKTFTMNREELLKTAQNIASTYNIIYIAHFIFINDNKIYQNITLDENQDTLRNEIWQKRLEMSLLGQGFFASEISCINGQAKLTIVEMRKNLSYIDYRDRAIHASQFIYALWFYTSSKILEVEYKTETEKTILIAKTNDEICEKISNGNEDYSYLAKNVIWNWHMKI